MPQELVAIDVAVLVSGSVAALAHNINRALSRGRPDALRFDDTHLPHVTLAQQFVERACLDELFGELDRILGHGPLLVLHIPGVAVDQGTISLAVDRTADLQRLHERVMDAIGPFEVPGLGRIRVAGADAFRANGEAVRPQDVDWVSHYRERSAYAHYRPHVTLGHGDTSPSVQPIDLRAEHIAVCELGRFCTCRAVLRAWTLGGTSL